MQLVIDISKEDWEFIKEADGCRYSRTIIEGVLNGTPLPKGHGRLVDIDLLRDQVSHDEREAFSKHQVWLLLSIHNKKIPIIIEADTEVEE